MHGGLIKRDHSIMRAGKEDGELGPARLQHIPYENVLVESEAVHSILADLYPDQGLAPDSAALLIFALP